MCDCKYVSMGKKYLKAAFAFTSIYLSIFCHPYSIICINLRLKINCGIHVLSLQNAVLKMDLLGLYMYIGKYLRIFSF